MVKPAEPDASGDSSESLASVGIGVRWFWKGYLGISFDLAYVLEGNNRRFADETTRAGTVDFHGNLFVRY